MEGFFQYGLAIVLSVLFIQVFDPVKCGTTSRVRALYACEGHRMPLQCLSNFVLQIVMAKYGRHKNQKAICTSDKFKIKQCGLFTVTSKVKRLCDGQPSCTVRVNNNHLGKVCPDIYKYLNVIYTCVTKPSTTVPPTVTTVPYMVLSDDSMNITTSHNNTAIQPRTVPTTDVHSRTEKSPNNKVYDREIFSRNSGPTLLGKGMVRRVCLAVLISMFSLWVP